MPKIFSNNGLAFKLAPLPDSPPKYFSDYPNPAQAWASVKKAQFNIKKLFFILYIADPDLKGTLTGYYDSEPFSPGDQCKNIITKTVGATFSPQKAKRVIGGDDIQKVASTLDAMCKSNFGFTSTIKSSYRRTNARDQRPGSSVTTRHCDSENPDAITKFYSYTFKFDQNASCFPQNIYIDPDTMETYIHENFGGGAITVVPKGFAKSCPKANGTLSFFGITYDSVVPDGNELCRAKVGQGNITLTWASSNKMPLLPSS
jgi:hypothetical protein